MSGSRIFTIVALLTFVVAVVFGPTGAACFVLGTLLAKVRRRDRFVDCEGWPMKNELVKLERADDGSVTCTVRSGETLLLPREAGPAIAKYFDGDEATAWLVGSLYAPAGSLKKTKLRLVGKAPASLFNERW
jgi:hypothetical protein